ncbi:MAG: small multi-drug export protein [Nanoarchaeota archaeon]
MNPILQLIIITLIPTLELRASIPFGIVATDLHIIPIFTICVITNILLGILVYCSLEKIIPIFRKIRFVSNMWDKYVKRTQAQIHKAVEKWGEFAVAIFIGIPLPGSGVYSGALASFMIGLSFKKFLTANIIGVLIAAIIVTIISFGGVEAFSFFIK